MSALAKLKTKLGVPATPATRATPGPISSKSSRCSRGVPFEKEITPPGVGRARERVIRLLEDEPELAYAAEIVDPDADPVRVVIVARGAGLCELLIDGDKFDPIKFLEMIDAASRRGRAA